MSDPAAVKRLVREWPDVLGRIAIVSRCTPNPFFRPLRAKDLDLMKGWEIDPQGCIRELLEVVFRREGNFGSFENRAGDAVTSVYILVYLCPRPELAWELLRIFVPILRPGLWDDELRWYLELMFFEHAWEAAFDFDHLREPQLREDRLGGRNLVASDDAVGFAQRPHDREGRIQELSLDPHQMLARRLPQPAAQQIPQYHAHDQSAQAADRKPD